MTGTTKAMHRNLVCALILAYGMTVLAQAQTPVAITLETAKANAKVADYELFTAAPHVSERDPQSDNVTSFERLSLQRSIADQILSAKPEVLSIPIPGDMGRTLDLYRVELFSPSYQLRTSRGEYVKSADGVFYHGQIQGNNSSIAAVSIFDDEAHVMWADADGNKRIQKDKGHDYILIDERTITNPVQHECFTSSEHDFTGQNEGIKTGQRSVGGCVEIYFECDLESYEDNGSDVAETEEWVTALFNEVSILYENENIPIAISDIMVWTETDPYAGLTSTSQMLSEFVDQINDNDYDGRLAHLLSTRSVGGGIAYVDVLCSNSIPCAVSGSLSTNITPFPSYSWNVEVVAHELGHNFGSRHTHRCVWNGNNTQIDDCGNEWANNAGNTPEGNSCYDEDNPILPYSPVGGTVMSYCHLVSGVGINFNNGFGPQPGDLIYDNFITASCTTGECFEPECTALTDPVDGATNVDTGATINWEPAPAADGYKVTVGITSGGSELANNVDVGNITFYDPVGMPWDAEVFVKITPYNGLGDAQNCPEESFFIEPDSHPACTELTSPFDGEDDVDVDADLTWEHAIGNQVGYLLTMGTTPGGSDILDMYNVGNVNSYDPGTLPSGTEIFVTVLPFNNSGAPSGCIETSFTTEEGLIGDNCSGAKAISCGTTVSGSTTEANEDDVSTCGTSITAPGVWYTFTGDGSNVVLSMCDMTNYDSKINVYRGSCAQLICVAGNDDVPNCSNASAVEFESIPGANYFVLVQGWGGNTGSFSLTMACAEPPLCPSQAITAEEEWISDFSFGSFDNPSGSSIFSDFTQLVIEVDAGASYPVSATPDFLESTYDEYFSLWADFNEDGDFEDTGELLFESGPTSDEVSGTAEIPAGTLPGEYRLRLAMKYNSFPDACEVFTYGEVEEYTLKIRCNTVVNTLDDGPGSLRYACDCVEPGETINFSSSLNNSTISLTSDMLVLNKDISIIATTAQNITLSGATVTRTFRTTTSATVTVEGLRLVAGTLVNGGAILNRGDLTLRDIIVDHNPGVQGAPLIRNLGELHIEGTCEIHDP